MLLSDDVVDVERKEGVMILMDTTVFTTVVCSLPNVVSQCIVHQL